MTPAVGRCSQTVDVSPPGPHSVQMPQSFYLAARCTASELVVNVQDRSSWPPAVQSIVAAAEAAAAEAASADTQQRAEAAEAALESELDTLRTEQAAAMREASAALKAR
jgi:hypothetical protein